MKSSNLHDSIPLIDISALRLRTEQQDAVATAIGQACRADGFFYITGHGVDEGLSLRLEQLSREFFEIGRASCRERV